MFLSSGSNASTVCLILIIFNVFKHSKCLSVSKEQEKDFLRGYLEQKATIRDEEPVFRRGLEENSEKKTVLEWEDSGYFEGDLILSPQQREVLVGQIVESSARNGLLDAARLWPNAVVYYRIVAKDFSFLQFKLIKWAMRQIMRRSCVKFERQLKGMKDAVVIKGTRKGCFAHVGYQGGEQDLNLNAESPVGSGCFRRGTILHEMLHALGFYHMQSTYDRDKYINIEWKNIVRGGEHNFIKYDNSSVSNYGVSYDYNSVLHYSEHAFSKNSESTIIPKESGAKIGQRAHLSEKDVVKLNKMYCDFENK